MVFVSIVDEGLRRVDTDLCSARHMYYAAIPSGLARAEFVKQLVYRHKKWVRILKLPP